MRRRHTRTGVVAGDLTCATGAGTFVVGVEDRGTLDLAGHTLTGAATGVRCASRCTVTSTVGTGTIRNAETAGIAVVGRRGRVELSNLSLEDNPSAGVLTDFLTGKVRGTQVNLTGSGIGIQASQIRLVGLSATGNYRVVQARKAILQDSTIAASADTAISGHKAILTNSSVTGSGSGIDLLTEWRPRVTNSTCGVSRKLSNDTQTWSVCAND
ncbi:MAG: hypothetical protein NTZ61_03020 [Proteobacteria bacterium]|nr:hypothetical protein [Pseudomonadota bacterium]